MLVFLLPILFLTAEQGTLVDDAGGYVFLAFLGPPSIVMVVLVIVLSIVMLSEMLKCVHVCVHLKCVSLVECVGAVPRYLSNLWNLLDTITLALNVAVAFRTLSHADDGATTQIAVVNTLLLWFRGVRMCSGFGSARHIYNDHHSCVPSALTSRLLVWHRNCKVR